MILAFATNPIFLTIAAITGLILLLDDFITYLQGGETLLGDFWESFVDGAKVVIDWIDKAKTWFDGFLEGWEKSGASLAPLQRALSVIWSAVGNISGVFKRLITQIFGVSDSSEELADSGKATGELLGKVFSLVVAVIETIAIAVSAVATAIGMAFEVSGAIVIGVFKAIWAFWEALTEGFTSGDWLAAFAKMFKKLTNIMSDVWHNIKVAAIEFLNGLIGIINKFGAGIDPIEIPIKQTIETVGETTQGIANTVQKGSSVAETLMKTVNAVSATTTPMVAATNTVNADNSVKNSNNKITITNHIQSNNADARAVANEAARTMSNQLSAVAM